MLQSYDVIEIPGRDLDTVNAYKSRGRLIVRIEKVHEAIDFFGITRDRDMIEVTAKYEKSRKRETIVILPYTAAAYKTAKLAADTRAMIDGNARVVDRVKGRL